MLWYKKSSFRDPLKKNSLTFKNKHNHEHEQSRKCLYTSGECVLITYNEHTKTEGTIVEIRDIKREKKKTRYLESYPLYDVYD